MDDFVHENDCTSDEKSQTWVKEKLTSWADSIPHHDFRNFGQLISIQSIINKPAYVADLHTQYEKRSVSAAKEPYIGQTIPPREYSNISDVNPWDSELSSFDDFVDEEKTYYVNGSQHVENCTNCKGHGELTCPSCKGEKWAWCKTCGGHGEYQCAKCRGTGHTSQNCGTCGGEGRVKTDNNNAENRWNYINCPTCGGRKTVTVNCLECNGRKKIRCYKCEGTGKIECSNCRGTGTIPCRACDSQGKLMHYFQILQQLNHEYHSDTFYHDSITKSFPEFIKNVDSEEENRIEMKGTFVADLDEDEISTEFIENNPILTTDIQNLLDEADEPLSESTGINRQTLLLEKIEIYEVVYTMNKDKYTLLIYGEEKNIFALVSPITKVRDGYYQGALKAFSNKKYSDSHELLDKVEAMLDNQVIEEIKELRIKLNKRVARNYKIGSWVAGIISSAFLWNFTIDFLTEPRFYLPDFNNLYKGTEWMHGLHSYVVLGFFIFILLAHVITLDEEDSSLTKFYGARINSGFMRLFLSFVITTVNTGLIWISIIAANYIGLTLAITYPTHWAHSIYKYIAALF